MKTSLDVLKRENLNIVLQCTGKNPLLRKCENMLQEWNSIFYQLLTEI